MYVTIKKAGNTDWYSSRTGFSYKVIHEGDEEYLVESDNLGRAWRIVAKPFLRAHCPGSVFEVNDD